MRVAIIGNGIAGITAARELRRKRPDWEITVVSGESDHHYSRPALMYVYMGHLRYDHTKPYEDAFWPRNRIELVRAWVRRIDVGRKLLELEPASGRPSGPATIAWDKLVIATGSRPNRFGWPGQDLPGVQGLYSLQDLELLERNTAGARRGVIVGGGLIGIELAEMLHSRGIAVTLLVREEGYWGSILPAEESALVGRRIRSQGLDLRLGTELRSVVDDGRGRACAVITDRGERIDCQVVGLTAGVGPNVQVCAGSELAIGRGVLVDRSFRTSVPDVYAAGDCAEIRMEDGKNRIEQLWYTGRMHGEVLARVLAGEPAEYDRGIWFNSAKFLDLEYQTYGQVRIGASGERSLYWESGDGHHAMRIVHTGASVVGIHSLGIRYRHRACERWIREQRSVEHVLENLAEANFDPEFSRRHEGEMVRAWKEQLA